MKNTYDVIIIGAGVGGLVCGCYLAKSGLKVLIVEKCANVGGCCSSFKHSGHVFDSFAHSMGAIREGSDFRNLLEELDIWSSFQFERHEPSDIVFSPDFKISFWSDLNRTIDELSNCFPNEADSIDSFLKFLAYSKPAEIVLLRKLTFGDLLDEYFKDEKLKAILSITVLGNAGLPPSRISALITVKLFQEFLIDGGCYPTGGMQAFSNLLEHRYKELNGDLMLSKEVKKIIFENGMIGGVVLSDESVLSSKIVVSNCDVTQTYLSFLPDEEKLKVILKEMEPSISMFLNYFGTDNNVLDIAKDLNSSVWVLSHYDIEAMYLDVSKGDLRDIPFFLIHSTPDNKGFTIEVPVSFKDKQFWQDNKKHISKQLLEKAELKFNGLSEHIKFQTITTPQIIHTWTRNFQGAVYGWAALIDQFSVSGFSLKTPVRGLYLTGHWATQGFGISGVANIGKSTAGRVLKSVM